MPAGHAGADINLVCTVTVCRSAKSGSKLRGIYHPMLDSLKEHGKTTSSEAGAILRLFLLHSQC